MTDTPPQPLISRILIDLGIMTAIGVILGLIGPLGSFNDPLAYRLVLWVAFAWLGYALYAPIDTIAVKLAPILQLPVWALRITSIFVSSLPMSVAVFLLPRDMQFWRWPGLEYALEHYLYVVMIGGLITLVNAMIPRSTAAAAQWPAAAANPQSQEVTPSVQANPLLEALPAELGTQIVALEMEDHYVRVHTALGSELVLMRLRDAMAHIADVEGMQIHRSWWVARGAVEDVIREGRNVRLKLARDIIAPVSRANVSVLKDAGWI